MLALANSSCRVYMLVHGGGDVWWGVPNGAEDAVLKKNVVT